MMEGKSETSMVVATTENKGNSVISHQESFSQESSQSESTKKVGNATISEKSSSMQSEGTAEIIEKTGTGAIAKVSQTSSFTSTKDYSDKVNDDTQEPKVNELIKSFEENQVSNSTNVVKTEVEIGSRETNGSSSKALELINKFIDVPEPVPEKIAPELQPQEEPAAELEEAAKHVDPIDMEMNELSKEIEELKKEEERCEKSYVNRQTSTSSLEESFVQRLEERRYQNVREVLADSLPPLFKVKRPESLPPGNLIHLLHSVQIAQELNSVLKKSKKDDDSSTDSKIVEVVEGYC